MPLSTATKIQTPFTGSGASTSTAPPARSRIFARGLVTPVASHIIREARDGRHMSDHDFVCADVELIPPQ